MLWIGIVFILFNLTLASEVSKRPNCPDFLTQEGCLIECDCSWCYPVGCFDYKLSPENCQTNTTITDHDSTRCQRARAIIITTGKIFWGIGFGLLIALCIICTIAGAYSVLKPHFSRKTRLPIVGMKSEYENIEQTPSCGLGKTLPTASLWMWKKM